MFTFFRQLLQLKTTQVLAAISGFSILLSIVRVVFTGRSMFLFMLWNLFLAWVPWCIASVLYLTKIRNGIALVILILCWLAFFPNAPYVLTDFIHLGAEGSAPVWFDLILLLSYGFAGLLYGFVSLRMIESKLQSCRRIKHVWLWSALMVYLSCFGIYLGRFLRWNSWDLVTNLDRVLRDVYQRISNPFEHPTALVFTLLFGSLLNILYWSYKSFKLPEAT